VIKRLKGLVANYSDLKRFKALPPKDRELVVYAEGPGDWPHYEAVLKELTGRHGRSIAYVTSTATDPILTSPPPGITPFCVGFGPVQTIFFQTLQATLLVTTLPDLDQLHLKRSVYPVHYLYLFHSINSTHMVYRKGAFDAYDTVLCVGPHHLDEIRKTEQVYGLKPKELLEHGYGRLDALIERARSLPFTPSTSTHKSVVVAPSWGTGSVIEQPYGRDLIRILLKGGHRVALRLHPMTVRHHPDLGPRFEAEFAANGLFHVRQDMKEQDSLQTADVMISDWSGAATEFAFALERPVVFIDTPPKVNNPEYGKIDAPPLEAAIRTEIGALVSPSNLEQVLAQIDRVTTESGGFRPRMIEARRKWIYNLENSGRVGARHIDDVLRRAKKETLASNSARGNS